MARRSPDKRCAVADSANLRNVEPLIADKGGDNLPAEEDRKVRPAEGIARVCARLGQAQQGCVTRKQLLDAGVSRHAIYHAVATGALHLKHRGVYVVGHLALAPFADEAAALLTCRAGSMISHRSAAWLWRLLDSRPDRVDVTIVGGWCHSKRGIRIHRVTTLDDRELRRRHGLLVTSPARTIIDLASAAGDRELERVIAEARARRLLRDGELERALQEAGTRPGTAKLRATLRAEGDPGITRSDGERILRRYLREAGLPQFRTNRKVAGFEADFLWAAERVVLELDGYLFHSDRRAFERDRRKDMALHDAGYHVIRVTGRQLKAEPLLVIAHLARALDRAARARG